MKDETRGEQGQTGGVGDVMEIEQTWDREGIAGWVEQDRLYQRSINDPVSNKGVNLKYEMS